jgi:putative nucleotidyltransferase with HDIG domain
MTAGLGARVRMARDLAQELLSGVGQRWAHTVGVARRAEEIAVAVEPHDRSALAVAAWLHDIGYSPAAVETGLHSLDGARYLLRVGWPARVCALVAHHSGARFLAEHLGLGAALVAFPDEGSAVTDALTYADQTTGPDGARQALLARVTDSVARHGPGSPQALVYAERKPYLLAAGQRVERRLKEVTASSRR